VTWSIADGANVPQNAGDQWFSSAAPGSAPVRLFWFPHSGGNSAVIAGWQSRLGSTAELRVAQLPGCGPRLIEPPVDDFDYLVAELAAAVAALADRKFAFLGHSIGAFLAFEVARTLRRRGLRQPEWLWVCAAEGPTTRRIRPKVAGLPNEEFIEVLRKLGGTEAEVLTEPELMELLLPGIRANFGLSERYAYRPEPPLELPIRVLRGDADPIVDHDSAAGWARETNRSLPERVFPGDHFFLQQHEPEIARLVAAEFAAGLAVS
jgi:medium-chain acyl-[acyl-carrier-protein] hydrolase